MQMRIQLAVCVECHFKSSLGIDVWVTVQHRPLRSCVQDRPLGSCSAQTSEKLCSGQTSG